MKSVVTAFHVTAFRIARVLPSNRPSTLSNKLKLLQQQSVSKNPKFKVEIYCDAPFKQERSPV